MFEPQLQDAEAIAENDDEDDGDEAGSLEEDELQSGDDEDDMDELEDPDDDESE